jgi:Protein of unknown function (DUF3995)
MSKLHNVHVREIEAPVSVVGEILDTLGGPGDRVWANDIWVAEPVVFDRRLGVGADGGHGSIRYTVVEYEPGRRVVFRFSPDGGLSGTHGFELEPVRPEMTRITHFLDAETPRRMRPVLPILIGWHDAMVETAFDRVELEATGSLRCRARIPRWLRIVNGTEIAIGRALGKLPPRAGRAPTRTPLGYRVFRPAAVLVPTALAAIAAIHAAWALGWRWPGHDDQSLAERVVGAGAELPPEPVVWLVTGLLGVAGGVVAAVGAGRREQFVRAAAWSVAAVLLVRGAAYIPVDLIGDLESEYARLDLAIYSPLSLALGLGAAIVARGPRPRYGEDPRYQVEVGTFLRKRLTA